MWRSRCRSATAPKLTHESGWCRFGQDADVRAAVVTLRRVIHGGIHADFLNCIRGRRGQSLADGSVDGGIGLNRAARAEILTGIHHEAVFTHLAGGIAVEEVVGADVIQLEAVAGSPVSVSENRLIAEAGVGARTSQEIRVNTRAQNRQLREAAGAERSLLNGRLVHHVAGGGASLIHQGRGRDGDRSGYSPRLKLGIERRCPAALNNHLRVGLRLEALHGEVDRISADRQIKYAVTA